MKPNFKRDCAIILSAVAIPVALLSLPAYSQKDPQASVVEQLDSNDIKSPNLRGVKIYSNGDIELRNGTLIKNDGTTYFPNGSVSTSDGASIHPDGRRYLPGGFVYDKNGTETDLCKSEDCRGYRKTNFMESRNRKTRLRDERR
jgi:hypothetical protein